MASKYNILWPKPVKVLQDARQLAHARLDQLTKPQGSLGQLEDTIQHVAALQNTSIPKLESPHLMVFASDHGVAANYDVSRYDSHVTEEMCVNIAMGSSVAAVLARNQQIPLRLIDVGVARQVRHPAVVVRKVAPGTRDFTTGPAMDVHQFADAFQIGIEETNKIIDSGCDCVILGEMGIGNTTSASAMASWLMGVPVSDVVGVGTGIDDVQWRLKCSRIEQALEMFRNHLDNEQPDAGGKRTVDELIAGFAYLGGFEMVAMAGAMLTAGSRRVPILLDGLMTGVAALWSVQLELELQPYFLAGHLSPEPAHALILNRLGLRPLLSVGMRVGEGAGAVLAWPILHGALKVMSETATFADARVTNPHARHAEMSDAVSTGEHQVSSVAGDFTLEERNAVYKAIYARRDIRVFLPDKIEREVVNRILMAGHHGPSVGYMQPWNFILIEDKGILRQLQTVVERERVRAGNQYPDEKRDYYLRLKVEGLVEAPMTMCVTNDGTRGGPNVLGRNTIKETDLMSTSCAIENMWLAARAEGIAMGWVSIYEKSDVRKILGIPDHVDPSALLTIGYTPHFPDIPVLERVGWGKRLDIASVVFENRWGQIREEHDVREDLHTRRR